MNHGTRNALVCALVATTVLVLPGVALAEAQKDPAQMFCEYAPNMTAMSKDLVYNFFGVTDNFARAMYTKMAGGVKKVASVAFAVYLCFQVLKVMSPFGSQPSGVWKNVAASSLIFMFVMVGLSDAGKVLFWDYVYGMLLYSGIDFMALLSNEASNTYGTISVSAGCGGGSGSGTSNSSIRMEFRGMHSMTSTAIVQIENLITKLSGALASGVVVGITLIQHASKTGMIGVLQNIQTAAAGLGVAVAFGLALITYPLHFLDIALRFAVAALFAPIAMVCAVFPWTRQYTKRCFDLMVQAAATLVVKGMIFGFSLAILVKVPTLVGAGGDYKQMIQVIGNDPEKFNLSSPAPWMMAFAAFMVTLLVGKASGIASALVGGAAIGGIGEKMSGMAGNLYGKGLGSVGGLGMNAIKTLAGSKGMLAMAGYLGMNAMRGTQDYKAAANPGVDDGSG